MSQFALSITLAFSHERKCCEPRVFGADRLQDALKEMKFRLARRAEFVRLQIIRGADQFSRPLCESKRARVRCGAEFARFGGKAQRLERASTVAAMVARFEEPFHSAPDDARAALVGEKSHAAEIYFDWLGRMYGEKARPGSHRVWPRPSRR